MSGFPEPWTQLRLVWLRGKIEAGRGDEEAAEERFLAARAGFLGQRNAYDAAMVSLEDLAVMYLRQGRTAEVRQLAEEMVAVFQEQGLPDDALRALRLCAAAAQREELTAAMVGGSTFGSSCPARGADLLTHGSNRSTFGSDILTHGADHSTRGSDHLTSGSDRLTHGSSSSLRGSDGSLHGSNRLTRGSVLLTFGSAALPCGL